MFSVAVTYLGTAVAGHLIQGDMNQMASVYDRLAGMDTITNPEELVRKNKKILRLIKFC